MNDTRSQVILRSDARCEALVRVPTPGRIVWTRCFRTPVEVHHMLTRSRGGLILDEAGETAHLIALCSAHHKVAHSPGGHRAGLMMNGYVTRGADGVPVYQGSDPRLARYCSVDVSELPEEASGAEAGKGLRGAS